MSITSSQASDIIHVEKSIPEKAEEVPQTKHVVASTSQPFSTQQSVGNETINLSISENNPLDLKRENPLDSQNTEIVEGIKKRIDEIYEIAIVIRP